MACTECEPAQHREAALREELERVKAELNRTKAERVSLQSQPNPNPSPSPNPKADRDSMQQSQPILECPLPWMSVVSTGGRLLKIQSSYNSTVAAGILTETAFICSFQSVYWEQSLGWAAFMHLTRSYPRFSA